jgi:trimeric autotransporter adhesin
VKHVKFHLNRFLHRVRIHGGEFDTSARAMYRDEVVYPLQAELRIVRSSTIERKQMSTKTTFKRIALVTVAALGFGVMSVVPSNAAINADTLTLSSATAAQTTAETATSTSAIATLSFLGDTLDSASVTASLVSAPAGNTALPVLTLTETASAYINANTNTRADAGYAVLSNNAVKVVSADSTKVTTAKFRVFIASGATAGNAGAAGSTAAPTVAGTYVVKLTPAAVSGSLAASTAQTLTITVTKASSQSTTASAASTVLLVAGETVTSAVADVDDVVTGSKSIAAGAPIGQIVVTQYSSTLVATAGDGESITATITGAGLLGAGTQSTTTDSSATATGRTILAKKGELIAIFGDGTSGKGTITLTTAAGLLLSTKTVMFYDNTPTTVVATVKKSYPAAGKTTTKVLSVVVNDASGNFVGNATVTAYPTDTATTVASQTAQTCSLNATATGYDCSVVGASASKFGVVAYTVKAVGADTAKTEVKGSASVTFADIIATSVTITGATATDGPGATVVYTLTAKEKNGYPVADTTYNSVANGSVGAAFFETVVTSGWSTAPFAKSDTITTVSGVATSKGVLPVAGSTKGTWTLSGDGTAASGAVAKAISGTDIVVTTTVVNVDSAAAQAAAEEATAAANDATDAALSAAEAAEAATAMAQEAVDAVAELSAQVTSLISELRAQITALTNLVVKIQKKVKA